MNEGFTVAELDRQLEFKVPQEFPKAMVGWRAWRLAWELRAFSKPPADLSINQPEK
jgi:hypothetical protein